MTEHAFFFFLSLSANDIETHIKTLCNSYMRKTKGEKKSGSGLEHLSPRVMRATHSTLPMPSAAAAAPAETSSEEDEADDDDTSLPRVVRYTY